MNEYNIFGVGIALLALLVLLVIVVLIMLTTRSRQIIQALTALKTGVDAQLSDVTDLKTVMATFQVQESESKRDIRQDLALQRNELSNVLYQQTQNHSQQLETLRKGLDDRMDVQRQETAQQLTAIRKGLDDRLDVQRQDSAQKLELIRNSLAERLEAQRQDTTQSLELIRAALEKRLTAQFSLQREELTHLTQQLAQLTQTSEQKLEAMRKGLEERLDVLRQENAQKLEQMRATVDEKLQSTLETRLGESFKQVADRLEQVYKGLGEMQALAVGVGDLKRVLSNVKTRGTWGEVQLAQLLQEMLSPQQFAENIATIPGSNERVEFAIRLPGRDQDQPCWLPIDAKFPLDHWQRLQVALENADTVGAETARKGLDQFLREQAKAIREKYVQPPHTTDFAILFVPSEGLYAEIMARSGLSDRLQHDYRVMLAGPNNLVALLSSLQMGFRTLAIEKRSSEVWQILAAVKTEFQKFGDVLAKTSEKLTQAKDTIDKAGVRTRAIERKLRSVESLPEAETMKLLPDE